MGALYNEDWSKIVLPFGTASAQAEAYFEAHRIYCEFDDGNYLMFYLSPASKRRELKKLVRLAARLPRGEIACAPPVAGMAGGKTVVLPPAEAVGRTCASDCGLFPPCVPLLFVGDVVSEEAARRLAGAVSAFGLAEGKIIVYEA